MAFRLMICLIALGVTGCERPDSAPGYCERLDRSWGICGYYDRQKGTRNNSSQSPANPHDHAVRASLIGNTDK